MVFRIRSDKIFSVTLGLGVALSFLTAVIVSRIMLKSVSDLNIAKHPWLYGVKLKDKETKEVKA
jgi:preprotein translocase subunit SecD